MKPHSDLPPSPPPAEQPVSVAEQYGRPLERYLLRRLRNGQDVRDLAQEVYLRLLRVGKAEFAAGDSPAHLYWVASHVLYEYKLRAGRERVSFDSETLEFLSENPRDMRVDPLAEELDVQRRLTRALSQLPATHRAVILLHKRDGLSFAEVAQKLGLSRHTVKKYVSRSLSMLRAMQPDARRSR